MREEISYAEQVNLFSPAKFDKQIHVIGCGALGSHIVYNLAKMGALKIKVYDHDFLEAKNIINQTYGLNDLPKNGKRVKKIDALYKKIKRETGLAIEVTGDKVAIGKNYKFDGVVFLCVDSMAVRKEIFDNLIKMNILMDFFIETRLGSESGRIYAIEPFNILDVREYEKTLYSDEEASVDVCGKDVIITTASMVANIATHKLTKIYRGLPWRKEIIVSLNPTEIITRTW